MSASIPRKLFLARREELEKLFHKQLSQIKSPGSLLPLDVVVDTNLTGVHLRRMLAWRGYSHLNLHFSTFPDLARTLTENLYSEKREMPFYGKERLVQKTIQSLPETSYFAPVSRHTGFGEALLRTFEELRASGVEEFTYSLSGEKKEHLKELYREYIKKLEPYDDEISLYQSAVEIPPENLPCPAFIMYGVTCLSQQQKELVAYLSRNLPAFVFLPPAVKNEPFGREMLKWYRRAGFELEEVMPETNHKLSRREYLQLRINLQEDDSTRMSLTDFQTNSETCPADRDDNSLELWSAPEEVEEARQIARRVLELANQGYYFREIAILVKDPGQASLLKELLTGLEVPVYLPSGRSLENTPTGRSILLFLQLAHSNWSRGEVMNLVTSAPLNFKKVTGSSMEPSPVMWDFLSVEAGITRGISTWFGNLSRLENRYQALLEQETSESLEEFIPPYQLYLEQLKQLKTFVRSLHQRLNSFPRKASWGEMVSHLESFVQEFFLEGEEKAGLLRHLSYLRSLEHLEDRVSLEEALELVSRLVKEASLPGGEHSRKGVTICSPASALHLPFKVVFLPGVLEQNYPSPYRPDPLLLEEERKQIPALPLRREEMQHQELQFFMALDAATERLYLSYPRYQAGSGREQVPSHYLLRLAEILVGKQVSLEQLEQTPGFRRVSALPVEKPEQAVTPEEFDQAVLLRLSRPRTTVYLENLYPWFPHLLEQKQSAAGPGLTPHQGMLVSDTAQKQLLEGKNPLHTILSVSYLKSYTACPYRFFLEKLLRLAPLEEPEERGRLESVDRGDLMHRALERFFREASSRGLLPLDPQRMDETGKLLEEILEACFREAEEKKVTGYPLLWKIDQEQIKAELQGYLEKEARENTDRFPYGVEIRFGGTRIVEARDSKSALKGPFQQEKLVTLELPSSGDTLCFQGRIDRLDLVSRERFQVLDYKTGKARVSSRHLQEKISLQLSIYLIAAGVLLGKPVEQISAGYVYLSRSEGYPEVSLEGEHWQNNRKQFLDILESLLEYQQKGYFFPYPENFCKSCPFSLICSPDISRVMETKKNHPVYQEFERIKEVLVHD